MSDKEQKELAELAPAQQTWLKLTSLMWGISCIWSVMIKRIKYIFYHTMPEVTVMFTHIAQLRDNIGIRLG